MKSYLIDTFIKDKPNTMAQFTAVKDGKTYKGWGMAKPLNYDIEYLDADIRNGMAQEVLEGRAIAVHFTEDEQALGEVPSLLEIAIREEKFKEKQEYQEYLRLKAKYENYNPDSAEA